MRTALLTALAMLAFAANSILCRLALGTGAIDAASFSAIRLASGAAALALIVVAVRGSTLRGHGSWRSAAALFLYAVPFSYAYLSLSAGTGALLLFGAVQGTMLGAALAGGERLRPWQWLGLVLATAGLIYLVLPGLHAPSPIGTTLMLTAGVSWGLYSLRGRGSANPLADTASNFLRSVPLLLLIAWAPLQGIHASAEGVALAVISGAVTSGVGYAIWYAALRGLTASRAGIVQLSVPALAATGGVLLLAEPVTTRLVLASVLILGGVAVAMNLDPSQKDADS